MEEAKKTRTAVIGIPNITHGTSLRND
jgi:hypothetical protein